MLTRSSANVEPSIVTIEVTVGLAAGQSGIQPNIGPKNLRDLDMSALRNWLLSPWPGQRYRRVLTKLAYAQATFPQIERRLEQIWRPG
jgi:hypothetical protein